MRFTSERPVRAGKYQYLLLEIATCGEWLSTFTNGKSYYSAFSYFEYSEKLLDLQEELKKEFYKLAEINLTETQFKTLMLTVQGLTQKEIAKALNINQSCVTKCLSGNIVYKKNKTKVYGGVIKKLQKICFENPKIISLLQQIEDEKVEIL